MGLKKSFLETEHVCPWWLAYTFDNPVRRIFHRPEQILKPHLAKGMTAVDIGCGMGYFSLAMAGIVGKEGRVIAVDIQQKMLDTVARRASANNLAALIRLHRGRPGAIGLDLQADFVLAFWMLHEVPDLSGFLKQIKPLLREEAKFLVVEPRLHVGQARFQGICRLAVSSGFAIIDFPAVALSRAVLLGQPDSLPQTSPAETS